MRSLALFTSALAVGSLALPQEQFEKRQLATVTRTVTVTTTVTASARNPSAAQSWAGPPRVSNPPRPSGAPPLFSPNIPSPDAGRTSTRRTTPSIPSPSPPVIPSSSRPTSSSISRTSTRTSTTRTSTTTRTSSRTSTPPANTGAPVPGTSSSSRTAPISSGVDGTPISNSPVPSSIIPPTPSNAPLDPGHTPGTGQASLSVADGAAYRNSILYHHNAARDNHGAAPLVWNSTIAETARWTAETCRFEHSFPPNTRGQGQNLFTISGSFFNVTAGITESWYKDEFPPMEPYFGEASIPSNVFPRVGHLTQLLWKGTTSVGCYSLDCSGRMVVGSNTNSALNKYTVCNYYPAGNVATRYAINVGLPESSTDLGSWRD